MSATTGNRWYAVRTQARAEHKALYNLRRQGFEAYLPQYLKQRRHARRTERVPAPLFPQYLFVRMDTSVVQWRPIRSTFGVADLMRNGNEPAAVPDGVVEEIRAREAEDGYIALRPARRFVRGERIGVIAGVLADHLGWFECLTDRDRVVLLLDLLGRQVRVQLPLESVSAVG